MVAPVLIARPARKAFERNSNGFYFDTGIIIQLVIAKLLIVE
jgi:hypothetical protein